MPHTRVGASGVRALAGAQGVWPVALTGRIRKDRCRCLSAAAAAAAAPARVPSFLLTPLPSCSCMQQLEVWRTTHPCPSSPSPAILFVRSSCTPIDRRVQCLISFLTFASSSSSSSFPSNFSSPYRAASFALIFTSCVYPLPPTTAVKLI